MSSVYYEKIGEKIQLIYYSFIVLFFKETRPLRSVDLLRLKNKFRSEKKFEKAICFYTELILSKIILQYLDIISVLYVQSARIVPYFNSLIIILWLNGSGVFYVVCVFF